MRGEFGDPTEVSTDDPVQGPKSSDDAHKGTHYLASTPTLKQSNVCRADCFPYHSFTLYWKQYYYMLGDI